MSDWKIEWERLESNDLDNHTERARVPGGWLVRVQGSSAIVHPDRGVSASWEWGIFTYGLCFVPDPPEVCVEVRDVSQEG